MNTDKIARGMLAALVTWIPWAAFTRPGSLPALYVDSEPFGSVFMCLLAATGLFIFIDLLVNSGCHKYLPRLTKCRANVYVAVMVLTVIAPYSAARSDFLSDSGLYFYSIVFVAAGCLCWVDTRAKWRAKCCI